MKLYLFKNLLAAFVTLLSFQSLGQCPLNTPEFPFTTDDDWNWYSWSSNLYSSTQMGGPQLMTNISFRLDNDGSSWNYTYNDIRIYVRSTAVTNFSTDPGYPGTGSFTQVYAGNMTFNGTGVYSFNFNVAPSFFYDGTQQLEVLFENRGGSDNTSEEPWFDRTNDSGPTIFIGKVGWGGSWSSATTTSSNRRFNLQINNVQCSASPLPVTLTDFNAKCEGNTIRVEWETSSELNNDYFVLERSVDNVHYDSVTTVRGNGTKTGSSSYSYEDNRVLNETVYYRLSQVDYDGKSEVFAVETVNCNSSTEVQILPNPIENSFKVYAEKAGKLSLMDLTGKVLIEQDIAKGTTDIQSADLKPSVYLARIVLLNGEEKIIRIVKK